MNNIDQHSAILSMEQALVPGTSLIDGRTEQDMLCFLSDFASVINFYDHNNKIYGNWRPFLLKDPVFLLAAIAKTPFQKLYSIYLQTCQAIESFFDSNDDINSISIGFNQLFDQLTQVFLYIQHWIYYMQRSDESYPLKYYTIHQVKTHFSKYFWAILSLQQNLFLSRLVPDINPVDHSKFYFNEHSEKIIWKQDKDKSPYWDILNLSYPVKNNTPYNFFIALKNAGTEIFNFFHTIIQHASTDFEKQQAQKSRFPDTLLLRTFINLLQVQQAQMNQLANKHLEFYYKDILKQSARPALADTVFVSAVMAKQNEVLNLPAGTLFDAGLDANKNPILFSNTEAVSLNPATIKQAFTLSTQKDANNQYSLYLQPVASPDVLQKDQDGRILSWDTFGSATATPLSLGMAIASPLLLLREGQRNITITLSFAQDADVTLLTNAIYYLSTKTAWFQVKTSAAFPAKNQCVLSINLDNTQLPVESFIKNPDGLNTSWPILKMAFSSFTDLTNPPVLTALTIAVDVTGLKTFQLYNNYGTLNATNPFALFGPAPATQSNFIIGNDEMFGKPLQSFMLELDWDNLPADFLDYYQEYNNYLANWPTVLTKTSVEKGKTFPGGIFSSLGNLFKSKDKIIKTSTSKPINEPGPYNNTCFLADFELLQNASWNELNLQKVYKIPAPDGTIEYVQSTSMVSRSPYMLFNNPLENYSCFSYKGKVLEEEPVVETGGAAPKYSSSSRSGFLRMTLRGPGFGADLYPNVVASIALKNAGLIYNNPGGDSPLPAAALPFTPKVKSVSANYTASQSYDLTASTGPEPLQCFLYAPFQNYAVYDNANELPVYSHNIQTPVPAASGIVLFPAIRYDGCLFLGMENLLPASAISFYAELARKYGSNTSVKTAGYYYLGNTGWQPLTLLSDSTNNFSCPGIIKVNVPDDISNTGTTMPGTNSWFAIGVNTDPAASADTLAQTVLIQPNGMLLQRSGNTWLTDSVAPKLAAGTITKLQTGIPQLAKIVQSFSSFGGKAAENERTMNRRVSNRLKTKDRAVSAADYFRLIQQEYDDIYYSKPVCDAGNVTVYVVKSVENQSLPNACRPLISTCKEEKITKFLSGRSASIFTGLSVSNFNFQYLLVTAQVAIKTGFECQGMQQEINKALNLFLSPWITTSSAQASIDQPISDTELAMFIKSIPGVAAVNSLGLQTWLPENYSIEIPAAIPSVRVAVPANETCLIVSSMDHNIQCIEQ